MHFLKQLTDKGLRAAYAAADAQVVPIIDRSGVVASFWIGYYKSYSMPHTNGSL